MMFETKIDKPEVSSTVDAPFVSVIVPCRNEAAHLRRFLESLSCQDYDEGRWEVILADGMSEDGSRAILAEYTGLQPPSKYTGLQPASNGPVSATETDASGSISVGQAPACAGLQSRPHIRPTPMVRVIDNPGRIVSSGLNAAIRAARGEIIARMDVHTEYAPHYLRSCVEVLRGTNAAAVGGPWIPRGSSYTGRAIAAAFASGFALGGARAQKRAYEGPVETVYLGCWRRQTLENAGLFDEDLVRNQDDELNLRLRKGGGLVWQSPRIRSGYTVRSSLGKLARQYFQYGFWKVRVFRKHGQTALRHWLPALFVLALLGGLLGYGVADHLGLTAAASLFRGLLRIQIGCYAATVLWFSLASAARSGWSLFPLLPAAFLCFHLPYGAGFLCALLTPPHVDRLQSTKAVTGLTR
jgi:succinoglycan biosynthesis protein ExoA